MNFRFYSLSSKLFLLFSLMMLAGCQQEMYHSELKNTDKLYEPSLERDVSKDELIKTLGSQDFDKTILMMNRIKRMNYKGDVLPILNDLWHKKLEAWPMLEKEFVFHPRIKLEIADILLQASRNGTLGLEPDSYREYARKHALSNDSGVAIQAISVIGVANHPDDVALLTEILFSGRDKVFLVAALSLAQNCAVDERQINDIAGKFSNFSQKEDLLSIWQRMQKIRHYSCK